MAVIAEVILRGISTEQYDAVRERTGWLEHAPDGGLAHLTWWEGSDCRSIDGWDSEAAFAAFAAQRLDPVMAALGLTNRPEVVFHPAHEVYTPRRGVVAATPVPEPATDNVERIRRAYEAFAAGDIPAVLELFDPELRWSTPEGIWTGGLRIGPQGAAEFFSTLPMAYAELSVAPRTFVDGGDTVVAIGTHRGRTSAGTVFQLPFVHVWTLCGGKATSFTEYFDTAPLLPDLARVPAQDRS